MLRLAATYSAFAAVATVINIATQALSMWFYRGDVAIPLSVIVGTGAGLLAKYWLDKRYIFRVRTEGWVHDGRLFFLYAAMGAVTTGIFWSTEYCFQWVWHSDSMRYLGGAIGLAIGYFSKYHLDRNLVFLKPGAL